MEQSYRCERICFAWLGDRANVETAIGRTGIPGIPASKGEGALT